jgi:hypothetical protein
MNSHVRRDLRPVKVRALFAGGEIEGTLHVPLRMPLLDFLNRGESLFRLTNAQILGQPAKMKFFALQRASTLALIPVGSEPLADPHQSQARVGRHVQCVMPSGGVVDGMLDVHGNQRVSDFLLRQAGFLAVRDAMLYVRDPSGATTAEPGIAAIAINASVIIGVSEIE